MLNKSVNMNQEEGQLYSTVPGLCGRIVYYKVIGFYLTHQPMQLKQRFLLSVQDRASVAAVLFTCCDLIRFIAAIELDWYNGNTDFAMFNV